MYTFIDRCFNCPALNGTISLDRHLGALLKALSFPEAFRSRAHTVDLLNPAAPSERQLRLILPQDQSSEIPQCVRRSRDTRRNNILFRDPNNNAGTKIKQLKQIKQIIQLF